MQKIFILVLILTIGLGVGFYFGVVFQKSQTPQVETEGKVTILELSCSFSEHTFLTIRLNNNFSDRTLKGNVTVYQNGRQWTSEVEWYYTGYGFAEIKCDSIDENQNFRITYTENYPKVTYLDRIIEWYEVSITYAFMKTEELKVIAPPTWTGSPPTSVTLRVKNSGTAALTVSSVKVNDVDATMTSVTLKPGDEADIAVSGINFTSGTKYEFAFYTVTGNRYPYTATAP